MARAARALRARRGLRQNSVLPRLSVFRSGKHIYAQIIDDRAGVTLAAASDKELKSSSKTKTPRGAVSAKLVGALIAQKASEKNVARVVFDRGGYKYHGRVKALAEGARAAGLTL